MNEDVPSARHHSTTQSSGNMNGQAVAALGGGPETLMLHPQEFARAIQLRQAVVTCQDRYNPPLEPLSDFEYVQFVLSFQDERLESLVEKIAMMQAFRREYDIDDSVEQGVELFRQFMSQQPGYVLSVEYLATTKNYLAVMDLAALFPSRAVVDDEQLRIYLGGQYYLLQAQNVQFRAIRTGTSVMVECLDSGYENCDVKVFEKLLNQLLGWFPKSHREIYLLNSPAALNVVVGLLKRIIEPNAKEVMHLGHQISGLEGQRIDKLYKQPSVEFARQRVVASMGQFLELRKKYEMEFQLPKNDSRFGRMALGGGGT